MMSAQSTNTADELADTLYALGIRFVQGGESPSLPLQYNPEYLISALAESSEARLRLALIALFLEHPEYHVYVCAAAKKINPSARLTLLCYYSAAVLLQNIHCLALTALLGVKPTLPHYFAHDLTLLSSEDPQTAMRLLAQRHQVMSGAQINWLGTYNHALQQWLAFKKGKHHEPVTEQSDSVFS